MKLQKQWVLLVLAVVGVPTSVSAAMNDEPRLFYFGAEEFEYRRDGGDGAISWDVTAWYGTKSDRLVLRSEGEADEDETEELDTTLLWARPLSAYWNINLGWRGDWQPEARRNWAAVEFEGLAPGFIETRLSLLASSQGRWSARLEAGTEWYLTRRLKLVPVLEADWYRRADFDNGLGAGLTAMEAGLRLKYVIRPDLKPYAGFSWTRLTGETADLSRDAGGRARSKEVVAGLSFWF